jgi:hypothetical protein
MRMRPVRRTRKVAFVHVYSDNEKIRELLEDLFYNVLNVEFNLRSWVTKPLQVRRLLSLQRRFT